MILNAKSITKKQKKINSVWLTDKNINLGVLNICSMYHKQIDLLNLMQERNISIMCLTETWLNDSINNKELFFEDYYFFRSDRESKLGVGMLIFKKIQGSFKSCLKKTFLKF